MRTILTLVAVLYSPGTASAASQATPPDLEQAAILAVVDRFFTALATNDFATLTALRLPGGFNIVEGPGDPGATAAAGPKPGGTRVTRRAHDASPMKPGAYRERYWDPIVHVRGRIAVVWTAYEFWIDGKTTHCGIDVFDMVKEQGAWRIASMMWTVEPDACPELRPKDPSRMRPTP